jgi:hypothetical protein
VIIECTFDEERRAAARLNREWRKMQGNGQDTTVKDAYQDLADRYRKKGDALVERAQQHRDRCYKFADDWEKCGRNMDAIIKKEEEELDRQFKGIDALNKPPPALPAPPVEEMIKDAVIATGGQE